jgi:hypothetical protein
MAAWYDQTLSELAPGPGERRTPGTQIMETVTLSPDRIAGLAGRLGLQVVQAEDGSYTALPPNIDLTGQSGDIKLQFIDHWLEETVGKSRVENERNRRVQTYKIMDDSMAEACISLDTYADECLAVGFVEDPIQIKFSDKGVGNQVMTVLEKNEIIKRSRSYVRNLVKYGDVGIKIMLPNADPETDVTDIGLEYIDPLQWEAVIPKDGGHLAVGYRMDDKFNRWIKNPTSSGRRKKVLQPWEFVQMSVFDQDFRPYGRSLLEGMRIDFDHLVTLEALLALSRASRVERLVIKIPTGSSNPVQAAQKVQALKAQFKNIIFKDTSLGTKTYGKTPGLTDILFMPSDQGFDTTKLSSNVDLSSVEDVEYFRDKAISVTGLTKGYFLADQSMTDRGSALQAQDLKFARKLIQFQNAWAEGLTRLCLVIATYVTKADIENLEITVGIKKPPQLALTMIDGFSRMAETAALLINNFRTSTAAIDPGTGQPIMPPISPDLYVNLLVTLGMPSSVANLFNAKGTGALPGADQDYVVLKSSRSPEFSYLKPQLRALAETLRRPSDDRGFKRLERFALVS